MNKNDSIQAVRACMEFLSLDPDELEHKPISCSFENNKRKSASAKSGNLRITFEKGGDGSPCVSCNLDIIRGYGINYSYFDPNYQTFTYVEVPDGSRATLTCQGDGYSFDMTFSR
jgi:hypothetical protein